MAHIGCEDRPIATSMVRYFSDSSAAAPRLAHVGCAAERRIGSAIPYAGEGGASEKVELPPDFGKARQRSASMFGYCEP